MFRLLPPALFLVLFLDAHSAAAQEAGEGWPDYRGPGHQGHSSAEGLPRSWGEGQNVAWKTRIHGRAWSTPVVLGDEVWLTTASADGKALFAVVVGLEDGEIAWDRQLFAIEEPQFAHAFNSYASPSPCVDGDRVYLSFGSPGTACIEGPTRKELWRRTDLECDHFRGAGSSPIVWGDLLILTMDGADHQFVIALDKLTGETRWRRDRSTDFDDLDPETGEPEAGGDWRKAYSTPLVIEVDGEPQLISCGAKAAFAYDPRTGDELWMVRHPNHSSASRTLFGHGLVFLTTGFSGPEMLAIDPTGRGDVTETHVRWRSGKKIPKKPSPLLIGDHLYLVNDQGIVSCVEAVSGEAVWSERIEGEYSASLLYADGCIFACSEDGHCVVFRPGEGYESVGVNTLGDGFMASPVAVGRSLLLRSRSHLYRIEGPR